MNLEVIRGVYKRKSQEREKYRKDFIDEVFKALEKLTKEVFFEEAYIFGSLTKPYQFGKRSDVDLAFKGLDKDKLFITISHLSLELGRDVNVVAIDDVHFKDKILREGIKWRKY